MNFALTWKSFFRREARAGFANSFVYIFSFLALLGGLAPLFMGGDRAAVTAPLFLIQVILYLSSLFGLLIGLSSAQGEMEEWPVLFSQPLHRGGMVLAKFSALWGLIAGGSLLLAFPLSFLDITPKISVMLWGCAAAVGGVFISLGLAIGFLVKNRVRNLMLGIAVWLFFLAGFDFLAWLTVDSGLFAKWPSLWILQLMVNPLDAFRIAALLSFGEIPMSITGNHPLVHWWTSNLMLWFSLISALWVAMCLGVATIAVNRTEV